MSQFISSDFRVSVDPSQLRERLRVLKAGEELVYFRGMLMAWRASVGKTDANMLHVPELAWQLYLKGLIELVQLRHGEDDYSYIAVGRNVIRSKPHKSLSK